MDLRRQNQMWCGVSICVDDHSPTIRLLHDDVIVPAAHGDVPSHYRGFRVILESCEAFKLSQMGVGETAHLSVRQLSRQPYSPRYVGVPS